jgi:hypothetical protein
LHPLAVTYVKGGIGLFAIVLAVGWWFARDMDDTTPPPRSYIAVGLAGPMAAARVYVGAHYPADVLAASLWARSSPSPVFVAFARPSRAYLTARPPWRSNR